MARDESVAPKERVNIVYKPAIGDAQEEKELPLKLLVMGDFRQAPDSRPIEERKPIRVDKDTFSQVMREQNLSLTLNVPNKLTGKQGDELTVNLKFETDKDFGPDAIARKVPQLKTLLDIREALKFLRGPLGNKREFRRRIEQIVDDPDLRARILRELSVSEDEF